MNDDQIVYVDTSGMTANIITRAHTQITSKGVTVPTPDAVDKMFYEALEKYSMAVQMASHKHYSPDADHIQFDKLQGDYEHATSRTLRALFDYISRMLLGILGVGFAAGLFTSWLFAWLL